MGLCCGASQARRDRSADYEERRKQELLEALGEGYNGELDFAESLGNDVAQLEGVAATLRLLVPVVRDDGVGPDRVHSRRQGGGGEARERRGIHGIARVVKGGTAGVPRARGAARGG